MSWIPAGTFRMGSKDFYPEEAPVRDARERVVERTVSELCLGALSHQELADLAPRRGEGLQKRRVGGT